MPVSPVAPDRVDRIAAALEADPPEGFRGRYSREVWVVIVAAVEAAESGLCEARAEGDADGRADAWRAVCSCGWKGVTHLPSPVDRHRPKVRARRDAAEHESFSEELRVCAGCGDFDPPHWREGGWYCDGCAACEVCQSPYCDEPEHH